MVEVSRIFPKTTHLITFHYAVIGTHYNALLLHMVDIAFHFIFFFKFSSYNLDQVAAVQGYDARWSLAALCRWHVPFSTVKCSAARPWLR